MASYNEEYALYEEYLAKLEVYNTEYQKYQEYLSAYNKYLVELDEFLNSAGNEDFKTLDNQLSALKYITLEVTELKRSISNAILGDTVKSILAERDSLIELGKVEARAIDLAISSTNSLRRLLKDFTSRQTDESRYVFYIGN